MCGIAGVFGADGRATVEAMLTAVVHRGPDGAGFHIDPPNALHLGFRRLAIIDIKGGHQPMWNEDESVCVIFNGEIYNQVVLRQELISAGHVFRSDHSDTEVLVHGYEEWGDDLPRRLNGMFAFAFWDLANETVYFARDAVGQKPLFYFMDSKSFVFGSELSSLAMNPDVPLEIDRRALGKPRNDGSRPIEHRALLLRQGAVIREGKNSATASHALHSGGKKVRCSK